MQHNPAVFLVTGLTHHKGHRAAGEITAVGAAVGVLAVPVMVFIVQDILIGDTKYQLHLAQVMGPGPQLRGLAFNLALGLVQKWYGIKMLVMQLE